MTKDGPKLWEKQPWETVTAFDRFVTFYLSQTPPRSVDRAYNTYRERKGAKPASRASGTWRHWSTGRTANGEIISGAYSWPERAAAFDQHKAELSLVELEQDRIRFGDKIRNVAFIGLDRLQEMLEHPLIESRVVEETEVETVLDDSGRPVERHLTRHYVIQPAKWDLKAAAQLANAMARLAETAGLIMGEMEDEAPAPNIEMKQEMKFDLSGLTDTQLEILGSGIQSIENGRDPGKSQAEIT